jgi:hypothetical protein
MILFLSGQEIQEEAIAINIEVPVRVYEGNKFVDNLDIDDFEVYEEGVLQKIEAVYLISKTSIKKSEEKKKFYPKTSRNFYLLFEITEYTPKIGDAIDYFIQNVILPTDNLVVITPLKSYRIKKEILRKAPKLEIVRQFKGILKKNAWIGNSEYKSIMRDLIGLARALSSDSNILDEYSAEQYKQMTIERYENLLIKLESLRKVDQKRLLDFAGHLKAQEGQKFVLLFYQREFLPQLKPQDFDRLSGSFKILALFGYFFRDLTINIEKVEQAYSDSSISIHFLFFTKPAEHVHGIIMQEHSEDIFSTFREMAQATGGITDSSSNPEYLFQQASNSVENYYLLYYTPKDFVADGKFRKIEVKVIGKRYKVTHRSGYIAD